MNILKIKYEGKLFFNNPNHKVTITSLSGTYSKTVKMSPPYKALLFNGFIAKIIPPIYTHI